MVIWEKMGRKESSGGGGNVNRGRGFFDVREVILEHHSYWKPQQCEPTDEVLWKGEAIGTSAITER